MTIEEMLAGYAKPASGNHRDSLSESEQITYDCYMEFCESMNARQTIEEKAKFLDHYFIENGKTYKNSEENVWQHYVASLGDEHQGLVHAFCAIYQMDIVELDMILPTVYDELNLDSYQPHRSFGVTLLYHDVAMAILELGRRLNCSIKSQYYKIVGDFIKEDEFAVFGFTINEAMKSAIIRNIANDRINPIRKAAVIVGILTKDSSPESSLLKPHIAEELFNEMLSNGWVYPYKRLYNPVNKYADLSHARVGEIYSYLMNNIHFQRLLNATYNVINNWMTNPVPIPDGVSTEQVRMIDKIRELGLFSSAYGNEDRYDPDTVAYSAYQYVGLMTEATYDMTELVCNGSILDILYKAKNDLLYIWSCCPRITHNYDIDTNDAYLLDVTIQYASYNKEVNRTGHITPVHYDWWKMVRQCKSFDDLATNVVFSLYGISTKNLSNS